MSLYNPFFDFQIYVVILGLLAAAVVLFHPRFAAKPAEQAKKGAPLFNEWLAPTAEVDLLKEKEGWVVPYSVLGRLFYLVVTIGVPAFCFFITSGSPTIMADWQSGNFTVYVEILLANRVTPLFAPFLVFSSGAMVLLLFMPKRMADQWVVRFGIYTGWILAMQYTVLVALYGLFFLYLSVPVSYAGYELVRYLWPYVRRSRYFQKGIWLSVIAAVVLMILSGGGLLGAALSGGLIVGLAWVPVLTSLVAWRLLTRYELERPLTWLKGLMFGAWFTAWGIAWQQAIVRTLDVYASLPEEPPNCYIATAAAQGHPNIVGSTPVQSASGKTVWVNTQLQTLKAAELAVKVILPRSHRIFRWIYDCVGYRLAQRIHHPLMADCAYWVLKPFEWVARHLLALGGSLVIERIGRLYGKQ